MKKIKNFFAMIRDLLLYGGITKDQYDNIKKEVEIANCKIWRAIYISLSVIFIGMFVLSFFTEVYKAIRYPFLIMAIFSIIMIVITFAFVPKESKWNLLLRYLSYAALFAYGIYTGTFSQNYYSVSFYVILLLLALVGYERPIILSPVLLVVSVGYGFIFFFLNEHVEYSHALGNLINSMIYGVIAAFINIYLSKIKFNQVFLQKDIERERDTESQSQLLTKEAGIKKINHYLKNNTETGILLFIDIDDFKKINDSFGHDYGDQMITTVSEKIKSVFNSNAVLLRFGGDEFVAFMPDTINLEESVNNATELLKIHNEVTFPNGLQCFYLSIGIAIREKDDNNYRDLLNKADLALYKAKNNGKNQYQIYESSLKKDRD